ncbi:MAG: phosphatidate cytidylyltransferase [Methylacidiphilales bacterium]|nr:phosphatidate cytidylyltransferase [Candidatus Methylacidiphilales bacterium]
MFGWRLVSTVILISLVVWLAWMRYSSGLFVLSSLLCLVGQWEYYQMQENKGLKVFKKAGAFCGLVFLCVAYIDLLGVNADSRYSDALETLAILGAVIGILTRTVFEHPRATPVGTVALTLFGFFYVPFLFQFLLKILFGMERMHQDGIMLGLYLVAVTKFTDIGAYVTGSMFGRHKMSPHISPKKTWEGFFGGLLVALLTSLMLVRCFPEKLAIISGWHAVVLGLLLPVTSVVGDLAESVIKRDAQSKNSGVLIPGIGGSLDLIDSLLFTGPLFYSYLTFIIFS